MQIIILTILQELFAVAASLAARFTFGAPVASDGAVTRDNMRRGVEAIEQSQPWKKAVVIRDIVPTVAQEGTVRLVREEGMRG